MPHNIDHFQPSGTGGASSGTRPTRPGAGSASAGVAPRRPGESAVEQFRNRQGTFQGEGGGPSAAPGQTINVGGITYDEFGFEVEDDGTTDEFDPTFWQQTMWAFVTDEATAQAEALGFTEFEFASLMGSSRDNVWAWSTTFMERLVHDQGETLEYYTRNPEGINFIFNASWDRFRALNPTFGPLSGGTAARAGPSGPGRASGPTSQDIRNRFDVDALAQQADNIWRNMLLTTPKSSRSLAKAYVDEIVATKGEVALDFRAYVRRRAMDSQRFAVIYENKPDDIEPEQYLSRYAAAAAQVARPGNVENIAIGGARIGSDAATFGARLARTDEATGSAPFINGIESRMRALTKVFRG